MHDELVKAIRQNACHFDACGMCPKRSALCMDGMALQAADAIENLSLVVRVQKAALEKLASTKCCMDMSAEWSNATARRDALNRAYMQGRADEAKEMLDWLRQEATDG